MDGEGDNPVDMQLGDLGGECLKVSVTPSQWSVVESSGTSHPVFLIRSCVSDNIAAAHIDNYRVLPSDMEASGVGDIPHINVGSDYPFVFIRVRASVGSSVHIDVSKKLN